MISPYISVILCTEVPRVILCRLYCLLPCDAAKYEEIETCLIDEFREAFHKGDRRKMKRTAAVLSHFKVSSSSSAHSGLVLW